MSEIARATHERDKLILQASNMGLKPEQIARLIDRSIEVVEKIISEERKRQFLIQQKQKKEAENGKQQKVSSSNNPH